jgi:hypothetical protein
MANTDNPTGLSPIGHVFGAAWEMEAMDKDASGGAILIGDAVKQETDGNITAGAAVASGVSVSYSATGVAATHLVLRDPFTLFAAQDNADTNGFDASDRGGNVDIEANAGTGKISGHELDESTFSTTDTLDLHLRRLYRTLNNAYGSHGIWEVGFNAHRLHGNSAGLA